MTPAAQPLIAELECALSRAPIAWRSTTLRRLTDLFLVVDAEAYSDDQIAVFDDLLSYLIDKIDRRALAELSNRLARLKKAPINVVATLARHADMAVAGPMLEKCAVVPDAILVEVADKDRRDLSVLTTIVTRPHLSAVVTDVLIKRGTLAIVRKILDNSEARISEASFARLVTSVDNDKALAVAIAKRPDLPAELRPWLDQALATASSD